MTDTFADCERRDDGLFEQDVNAWSSVAYLVAGAVIVRQVRRAGLPRALDVLAVLVALEGAGSFLYHGAASDLAQALHDVPLVAMLAFIAGWHGGRLVGQPERYAVVTAVGGIALGAAGSFVSGATNAAVALFVGAIVITELVARRRRLAPVWTASIVMFSVLAVGVWLLGTPASLACDPDSVVQPHGLWHVMTAIVPVLWVDRAYAATRPDSPPLIMRRATDRVIGTIAWLLTHAFHRSVDVRWRDRMPPRRTPVLIVANHGNGFVDPIVVAGALGRLPRFLAKASLWKIAVARPFLGLAGVLPVYRSADGDRTSDNRSIFEACHRGLANGSTVAIFPEGTTGDRAGLDRVRSGAARIALGALHVAPDLHIVPIGLAFESRIETRSRAVVMFGEPIEVARFATDTEPGRADIHALTAEITAALEAVSPTFTSVDEREILRAAARTERDDAARHGTARFGDIEVVARSLAAAEPARREAVIERYRSYATRLNLVGLDDDALDRRSTPWWRLALSILAIVFGGALLVTVTLIHLPAVAVVVGGTALVHSTATKGTVRVLLGLVTGLLTWTIAGIVIADGVGAVVAAAAVAAGGAAALVVWPPLVREVHAIAGRWTARDRGSLMTAVLADRGAVIEAVRDANMSS